MYNGPSIVYFGTVLEYIPDKPKDFIFWAIKAGKTASEATLSGRFSSNAMSGVGHIKAASETQVHRKLEKELGRAPNIKRDRAGRYELFGCFETREDAEKAIVSLIVEIAETSELLYKIYEKDTAALEDIPKINKDLEDISTILSKKKEGVFEDSLLKAVAGSYDLYEASDKLNLTRSVIVEKLKEFNFPSLYGETWKEIAARALDKSPIVDNYSYPENWKGKFLAIVVDLLSEKKRSLDDICAIILEQNREDFSSVADVRSRLGRFLQVNGYFPLSGKPCKKFITVESKGRI